jgi:hypothetical protein
MKNNKECCFLSYNNKDKVWVEKLAEDLIQNGIKIWFDKWAIYPGDSIPRKIQEGFDRSNFFIIVLSKNALESKWVENEIDIANYSRISGNMRIIPILKESCNIPTLLQHIKHVNFEKQQYPSALRELINTIFSIKKGPQFKIDKKNKYTSSYIFLLEGQVKSQGTIEPFQIIYSKYELISYSFRRFGRLSMNEILIKSSQIKKEYPGVTPWEYEEYEILFNYFNKNKDYYQWVREEEQVIEDITNMLLMDGIIYARRVSDVDYDYIYYNGLTINGRMYIDELKKQC